MPAPPAGNRKPLSIVLKREVLTEAGYRCAVPTCRNILALDLHHIIPIEEGGPNALSNLLALCPTCHALYTRGIISREAIHAWKQIVVALSHAFDAEAISFLLFLKRTGTRDILVSGDGVLQFASLIATDLAEPHLVFRRGPWQFYSICLTAKGQRLLDAWCSGNREQARLALTDLPHGKERGGD
jgi:hypothetical protein